MEARTPWWKFVLAIVSFVVIFFFAPALISLLLHLSNFFTPKIYQNTNEWIYVLSCFLGMVLACGSLEKILNSTHFIFCMVICIIAAFYSVAVAVWNFAIGITELYELIGFGSEGVVATIFAVIYGLNTRKENGGK